MMDTLTITGRHTKTFINPSKSEGPARSLVILGLLYCSLTSTCRLGKAKRLKYLTRIYQALHGPCTSDQLEQLAGNLGFAAWVEPFCRPLLAGIFGVIDRNQLKNVVELPPYTIAALRVWRKVISRNRGLPFNYILNRFPAVRIPIFVDASTTWGIGGFHGYEYFLISHTELQPFMRQCPGWERYPKVPIARLELLAALVAARLFLHRYPYHIVTLYTDNTSVEGWLGSRRSPHPIIGTLVSAIEQIKYHFMVKLSVRFIPSYKNRVADSLSRNRIPRWLRSRGVARFPNICNVASWSNSSDIIKWWSRSC